MIVSCLSVVYVIQINRMEKKDKKANKSPYVMKIINGDMSKLSSKDRELSKELNDTNPKAKAEIVFIKKAEK